MTITKHADSHVDHNLTSQQLDFVLAQDPSLHGTGPVRVFTIQMPESLGCLPCGLYGPLCGDKPVREAQVFYATRGERKGESRLMKDGVSPHPSGVDALTLSAPYPTRPSRLVTIVAGPHDGHPWVLFTAYGGPLAPKEPFDFEDDDSSEQAQESRAFWSEHALAPQS
jgi:hypothetical protein